MYEVNYKKVGTEGPKFSMAGKSEGKARDEIPGPGAYDPTLELVK